jgi:hypothetical protein
MLRNNYGASSKGVELSGLLHRAAGRTIAAHAPSIPRRAVQLVGRFGSFT